MRSGSEERKEETREPGEQDALHDPVPVVFKHGNQCAATRDCEGSLQNRAYSVSTPQPKILLTQVRKISASLRLRRRHLCADSFALW